MGVTSYTQEFTCPITPARMFKALILESSSLLPKVLPQFIKTVHVIHGDGGPGSIEQINFTEASHSKFMKNRIEEVDKEKLVCKYSMIEGDALGDKLEFIENEVKFEAASNGGCICKMTSNYHTKAGIEIKEEEIKAGKEKTVGIYKTVVTFLLENPQAYA